MINKGEILFHKAAWQLEHLGPLLPHLTSLCRCFNHFGQNKQCGGTSKLSVRVYILSKIEKVMGHHLIVIYASKMASDLALLPRLWHIDTQVTKLKQYTETFAENSNNDFTFPLIM